MAALKLRANREGMMEAERTAVATYEPWELVLTRSTQLPLRFDVIDCAADGREVLIRNVDRTVTLLRGQDFEIARTHAGATTAASLVAGTITLIERRDSDGRSIDIIDGLNLPVASRNGVAFASPPPGMTSLQWVFEHVDAHAGPETSTEISEHVHRGGIGGGGLTGGKVAPRTVLMAAAPIIAVVAGAMWLTTDSTESERAQHKWKFAAPTSVPFPNSNVPSAARIALGRQLFFDTRLSADSTVACATCHEPQRGFSDGMPYGRGIGGQTMTMHSPTLWNLAWGNALFWDGRLATLEAQAVAPIENPREMGDSLAPVLAKLKADAGMVRTFASAFPEEPEVTRQTLAKALASYVRSLVSPPTRFDAWLAGQSAALTAQEKKGFSIFIGKGGCANCHSSWTFTDYAFHDIGLPSQDKGRGHVIGRPMLNHAFKTPTLRELTWTAPYMHDGSLKTLEEVVQHYETGGVDRPTRSPDMPRRLMLTAQERGELVSFLKALSSAEPPVSPSDKTSAAATAAAMTEAPRVGQRNKQFSMERVRVLAGQAINIVNDDTQPHNVFIDDPRMKYDSGWQKPGEHVSVPFPVAGDFQVFCGVHPNMRLHVEVEPAKSK